MELAEVTEILFVPVTLLFTILVVVAIVLGMFLIGLLKKMAAQKE